MKKRRAFVGTLAAVAVLILGAPSTAAAGAWAVASFDEIPAMEAGTPVDVGFTILQHGVRPVDTETFGTVSGGATKVKGRDQVGVTVEAGGVTAFFPGVPTGAPGHYVATVEVDDPGAVTMYAQMGWFGASDAFQVEVGTSDGDSSGSGWLGWSEWSDWRVIAIAAMALACLAVVASGLVTSRRRRSWSSVEPASAVAPEDRAASHVTT